MDKSRKAIQAAARAGYFSRGLVYTIISLFALLAAFGSGSNKDTKGALETILQQPFGMVLIAALILGLVGFVVWRLIQSILDADDHGTGIKGLTVRLALFVSALTYGALALYALRLIGLWGSSGGDGGSSKSPLSPLVHFVGPQILAGGVSLVFLGIALAHWWKAFSGKYEKHFDENEAPMTALHVVAIAGLAARGVVFLVLSIMIWIGVAEADSPESDMPGVKDALQYVQDLPFGAYLLGGLAVGLFLFSCYSFFEARWRRVKAGNF